MHLQGCTYSTLQCHVQNTMQFLCVGIHCIKNHIDLAVFKEVKFFELQKVPSRDRKIYCCSNGEGCSRWRQDTRSELKGKQLRTGELFTGLNSWLVQTRWWTSLFTDVNWCLVFISIKCILNCKYWYIRILEEILYTLPWLFYYIVTYLFLRLFICQWSKCMKKKTILK